MIKETLFHIIMYQTLKLKILMSELTEFFFFDLPVKNEEKTYEKLWIIMNIQLVIY